MQVGGTFWLTRLARDREATVRLAALSLLAHLAAPTATPTRRMLLQGWPEAGTAVLKVHNSPLQPCIHFVLTIQPSRLHMCHKQAFEPGMCAFTIPRTMQSLQYTNQCLIVSPTQLLDPCCAFNFKARRQTTHLCCPLVQQIPTPEQ